MPRNIPSQYFAPTLRTGGPFSPAETVVLTDVSETTLQNWTNKGYLGEDKLNLGRGAKRRFSLFDLEIIRLGRDLVEAGIAPIVAFEYAPSVQRSAQETIDRLHKRLVEDRETEAVIAERMTEHLHDLIAAFAANPDAGSSKQPFSIQIFFSGHLATHLLPGRGKPVLLLRVGLLRLSLASHLAEIKRSEN